MFHFSESKFKGLELEQQHKKCAELLHQTYLNMLQRSTVNSLLEQYRKMRYWMSLSPLAIEDIDSLLDRFHEHLRLSGKGFKEDSLIPYVRTLDQNIPYPNLNVDIYLDHVRTAHNVGSIIRTTEAFRLGQVHLSEGMCSLSEKQLQRAAMGCLEWISCYENVNLTTLAKPIIALETCSHALHYDEFIYPAYFTLVVGNEQRGCSDLTLEKADYVIDVPLYGRKNSLNVSNAFAIVAAQISKQARMGIQP